MIYNENGYILTESITVGKTVIVLPSDYILETSTSEMIEAKVKALKNIIKDCDNNSLKKMEENKKINYLSDKMRKTLKLIENICLGGTVGSLAGVIGGSLIKNPSKIVGYTVIALVAAFAFLGSGYVILSGIIQVSDRNKQESLEKEHAELQKLANDIISTMTKVRDNKNLPQKVRDKAYETIEKLSKALDKKVNKETKYSDFKLGGINVEYGMDNYNYEKNKTFLDKAMKIFRSKFDKVISDFRKNIKEDDRWEISPDFDIDYISFHDKSNSDEKCALLLIYISDNDHPDSLNPIRLFYSDKNGYYMNL